VDGGLSSVGGGKFSVFHSGTGKSTDKDEELWVQKDTVGEKLSSI
jgi:hypothetical protein